jgi:hypothetical protein
MLTSCDASWCHINANISDHTSLQRLVWYVVFSEPYTYLIYFRSIVVSYGQSLRINGLKSHADGSTIHSECFSFLHFMIQTMNFPKGTNGGLVQT